MSDAVIQIEGVTRTYHVGDIDVHALAGVDFTVKRGEFVAIMGSSGSGKSTLMSILGCLDRPSSAAAICLMASMSQACRNPTLPASAANGWALSSRCSTCYRAPVRRRMWRCRCSIQTGESPARKTRFARARQALDRLGLGDRAGNTPSQLSGGQQQRVAIARALINSPSLLLADEPTGNLDTRTSHEIMQTLTQLNREEGVTIVLVTHEPDIAAYADRTVTMRDGRILTDERKKSAIPAMPMAATDLSIFHPHSTTETASGATLSWAFGLMILAAAVQALARNKMRSALTMLGVFIGVAALIVMVAIGQGANDAVKKQLASLGTDLIVVVPGAVTSMGARGGSGSASTLTVTDALAIRRENQAVEQVAYLIRQSGQTEYASQNWTTNIQGVTPNYPPITNWQIAAGRGISTEDESSAALVAVHRPDCP